MILLQRSYDNRFVKKVIFFTMLVTMLCMLPANTKQSLCNAKSWTEDADQSIYTDNKVGNEEKEELEEEEDEPSKIEKWVAGMISGLSKGINDELGKMGISLDQVICGRVGSGGEEVALFTFELVTGNPYGTISAVVYQMIRSMVYVIMALVLTILYVKAMYSSGTGQSRERLKSSLTSFAWYYAVLYLMPYLLDFYLYIRDQFLYAALVKGSELLSGGNASAGSLALVDHYMELANETPTLTNALMFLGAVIITFYFIVEYAGMAMAMLLMFILFPYICLKANIQKDAMNGWVWDVFSITITPILDMTLMMVPLLTGTWFPNMWLLKMVMCGLIIPSRGVAKRALGLSSAGAGLLNGMMAIMALRTAGGMAKNGMRRVSSIGEAIKNGKADKKRQQYHSEMAAAEQESERQAMEDAGYGAVGGTGIRSDIGQKNGFFNSQKPINSQKSKENKTFGLENNNSSSAGTKNNSSSAGAINDGSSAGTWNKSNVTAGKSMNEIANDLSREREGLANSIQADRTKIASLNQEKAGLERKNAELREEEAMSGGTVNHSSAIAKNNKSIAKLNEAIAGVKKSSADSESRMADIDGRLKKMGMGHMGKGVGASAGIGAGTASSGIEQEIARKYADISNFESPEFSSLSHADKARLYQKRARKQFASAAAQAMPIATGAILGAGLGASAGVGAAVAGSAVGAGVGTTGSVGGALVGLGAGMFFGPAATVQTMAMGSAVGSAGNAAAASLVSAIAGKVGKNGTGKQQQTYVSIDSMMAENIGEDVKVMMNGNNRGTSGNHGPVRIDEPRGPLPTGSGSSPAVVTHEYRGAYQNAVGSGGSLYDMSSNVDKFVSSNFGNIASHIGNRMSESGFRDDFKHSMSDVMTEVGYGRMKPVEKQQALCRGAATFMADEAMKMVTKSGVSAESAEYGQIYQKLLQAFSTEKTIQMLADAMIEKDTILRSYVEDDDM